MYPRLATGIWALSLHKWLHMCQGLLSMLHCAADGRAAAHAVSLPAAIACRAHANDGRWRLKGKERAMARVVFTANIQRFVLCPEVEAEGSTVRDVLEKVFADNPRARGYVLDDQSALRKHIAVFVDGAMIRDRARLSDPVDAASAVYVFQALSGG